MRIHLTTIRRMVRSNNKRSSVLFQNGVINGGTVEVIGKSFNSPRNSECRFLSRFEGRGSGEVNALFYIEYI